MWTGFGCLLERHALPRGRLCHRRTLPGRGRGNRVDVRHLPAGIYVVHAANARGTAHLKAALTR